MVQEKSQKENFMFRGIRVFSMAVLISFVVAGSSSNLQAQEKFKVESKLFDFSDLEQVDEVKKSTAHFKAILDEFKDSIKEAKTIVIEAKRAYLESSVEEKDAAEAKLIDANSKARSIQITSLEKYNEAAAQHVKAMDAAFGELERGKIALAKQVAEGKREEAASLAEADKVKEQLAEIANNKELYVDTNGKLNPKLKADVKRLNALYKIKVAENRGAAIYKMQAEGHRKAFDRTAALLLKKKDDLAHSVEVATVLLASIGKNASWEGRSLSMRNLARKFKDLASSMPDDVTAFFPEVIPMGLPGETEQISSGDAVSLDDDEEINRILDGFKSSKKKASDKPAGEGKKSTSKEAAKPKKLLGKGGATSSEESSVPSAISKFGKILSSLKKGEEDAD